MKKGLFFIPIILMFFSLPVFAAFYKCTNENGKIEYRDKPCKDGKQETLQQKSARANLAGLTQNEVYDLMQDGKEFLDNLKQCKPHSFSYELPSFGASKNEIAGKKNGLCHVVSISKYGETTCDYSKETITLLTSDRKYREMEEGKLFGQQQTPETARMAKECSFPR